MMRKRGLVTMFVVFGVLISSLLVLTTYTSTQGAGDAAPPLQTTHHNTMSNNDAMLPMTDTLSMGDMTQMMGMMMQMMGNMQNMMGTQPSMMTGTMTGGMPMTGTMPMSGTMPMGDMAQMMPMMMQMMGHHMQMMGHGQMVGNRMHMTDTMPMSGTMPMGDMSQMMQMMGNMQKMMGAQSGMMAGTMPMTGTMPMSGTMPMGDMSPMMPMLMQMMMGHHVPMMSGSMPMTGTMPMMDSMMPMTGTMPMDNMRQMMPMMTQVMGYQMQMMGLHMQMMGLHMQMHGSASDAMSMRGMDHPQQQGMMRGGMTERQAKVAETGGQVMPFDLDATTHIFEKNEQGGLQQVIADDPSDTNTIEQIRSHLAEEAERFAQGDFRDPQMIHGAAMPGLHELMMSTNQVAIEYSELPNGAQILYATDDADLIDALHRWFDAQVADHGQHAADQR